jgi:protein involved in polysaccharide export with SLBB domain
MIRVFIIIVLAALLPGCVSNYPVPEVPDKQAAPHLYVPVVENEYRFQVGDSLSIRSYFDPQLNQDVFVRPDGRISLLLLGDVFVVGMTPSDLDKKVTQAYRRVVDSPEITVVLKETSNSSVYLGGEVKEPSVQPLRGQLTLLQSVTLAGGFLPTANLNQVLLLRKQPDGSFKTFKLDAEKVLTNKVPDIYLQRYDIVYIPKSTIANVDLFVEQYINRIIPSSIRFTYGWIESKDDSNVTISP